MITRPRVSSLTGMPELPTASYGPKPGAISGAVDSKVQAAKDSGKTATATKNLAAMPFCTYKDCKKKVMTGFDDGCNKCNKLFCKIHWNVNDHQCTFDFKGAHKKFLEKQFAGQHKPSHTGADRPDPNAGY